MIASQTVQDEHELVLCVELDELFSFLDLLLVAGESELEQLDGRSKRWVGSHALVDGGIGERSGGLACEQAIDVDVEPEWVVLDRGGLVEVNEGLTGA